LLRTLYSIQARVPRATEDVFSGPEYRAKPRLFGKFFPRRRGRDILCESFIKLRFILRQ
jgi:hypothetical protein